MYTFDKESKSIVTPAGDKLKGKAVTEHLNQMYSLLNGIVDIWRGFGIVMDRFDMLMLGEVNESEPAVDNGDSTGRDGNDSGEEPTA